MKKKENIKANILSRKLEYRLNIPREYLTLLQLEDETIIHNIPQVRAITIKITEPYANRIKKSYKTNANAKRILQKPEQNFTTINGLILFYGKVYIPQGIRKQFVKEQHELKAYGH